MLEPQEYVARLIELHGGREKFFADMDERFKSFNAIWDQDAESIGRVLRAHLAVEHFLEGFISYTNPHLPSLENVRLTFNQKVKLLPDDDSSVSFLKPGIRKLNSIRNRMAHRLKVEISEEDRAAILAIPLFRAMRTESAKGQHPKPDDPLSVLEDFAMFAANLLHSASNPSKDLWAQAAAPKNTDAQQGADGNPH
jgi:hypothetical protein